MDRNNQKKLHTPYITIFLLLSLILFIMDLVLIGTGVSFNKELKHFARIPREGGERHLDDHENHESDDDDERGKRVRGMNLAFG
jgi:hypothetical protein